MDRPRHVKVTYPMIGENLVVPACRSSGLQITTFSPCSQYFPGSRVNPYSGILSPCSVNLYSPCASWILVHNPSCGYTLGYTVLLYRAVLVPYGVYAAVVVVGVVRLLVVVVVASVVVDVVVCGMLMEG
jgi:hypothetical protein